MAVAKALGASRIIAVDKVAQRLEFATKYVATDSFISPQFLANESIREYSTRTSLFRKTIGPREDGDGIDPIVDTSWAETSLQIIAKNGGTFVHVGVGRTDFAEIRPR
ncbi:hypothetical protein ACEPAF_4339 [Sanghuangporus sanghuang]